jgi:hypothetical protein
MEIERLVRVLLGLRGMVPADPTGVFEMLPGTWAGIIEMCTRHFDIKSATPSKYLVNPARHITSPIEDLASRL